MTHRKHINAYILATAALLIMALGTWIKLHPPAFDVALLTLLLEHRHPRLDVFFRIFTWLGSLYLLLPLGATLSYMLFQPNWRGPAGQLIGALLASAAMTYLLKFSFDRPRPHTALLDTNLDYAFPSNHSAQITAFTLMLFVLIRERRPGLTGVAGWMACIVIPMVGLSRLYLQVHYPTDIVAGILCGAITVMALRAWTERCPA